MRLGTRIVILIAVVGSAALAQQERPIHVVRAGDTLYALAQSYETSVATLRQLNGLQGDLLRVGTEIVLPMSARPTAGYRPFPADGDDTWESVAEAVGRSVAALRSANPDVPEGAEPTGRLLLIPPGEGATYRAAPGDTLARIAARFGVETGILADRNAIDADEALLAGQPVLVPFGAVPVAAASAEAPADPRAVHREAQAALLRQAPSLLLGISWPDAGFEMPVTGRLSSAFGWRNISVGGNRFHGGIDIAADPGTPVRVARPGVVVRAGWIGAYGYAVYVDHGDGSQTRYAHMRAIHVRPGETLVRGDTVGEVGSTGASTGPHLHFEVRIDGRAVDPLAYLASR